jgi:tetratricopeptide (TPR) repeat protein
VGRGRRLLPGRDRGGNALYAQAAARARQEGTVGLLPTALEYLAPVELAAGRYDDATASATEGLRLAGDTGNDTSACRNPGHPGPPGRPPGRRGRLPEPAAEALDRAAARGLGLVATLAGSALATLELGLNRPAEALARLERLLAAGPGAGSPFFAVYAVPDLVEAAVRSGRPEAATGPLAAFEQLATMAGTAEPLAQLARCRGLLAPDEAAATHFEDALTRHEGPGRPFDLARTQLACGEALRRATRRGEARIHLREALASFEHPQPAHSPGAADHPAGRARAEPTARSAPSCSSAAAPSTTTCATCS